MQQSKPPIATKPKIPTRRFVGKLSRETENDNVNLKKEHENQIVFCCEEAKNKTSLKSFSPLHKNIYLKSDANDVSDRIKQNNVVQKSLISKSQVQQMKSKLFAKQQSEVLKLDRSVGSNKSLQNKYSKELEEVIGMRIHQDPSYSYKNEKALKRLSKSFDESSLSDVSVETNVQQQKILAAEIMHVQTQLRQKIVEHVPVQQTYDEFEV